MLIWNHYTRVGRAIGKNEEEVAVAMMLQIKDRCNPIEPPAISSDGNDRYPEACSKHWGSCLNTLAGEDLQLETTATWIGNVSKLQKIDQVAD
jgi:hypothetical protein